MTKLKLFFSGGVEVAVLVGAEVVQEAQTTEDVKGWLRLKFYFLYGVW